MGAFTTGSEFSTIANPARGRLGDLQTGGALAPRRPVDPRGPARHASEEDAASRSAAGLSTARRLRHAHALYDLAEEIRLAQPEAARNLERAADLLLQS